MYKNTLMQQATRDDAREGEENKSHGYDLPLPHLVGRPYQNMYHPPISMTINKKN
jgi:hypothetical protein